MSWTLERGIAYRHLSFWLTTYIKTIEDTIVLIPDIVTTCNILTRYTSEDDDD
jgi:hypothetical protein